MAYKIHLRVFITAALVVLFHAPSALAQVLDFKAQDTEGTTFHIKPNLKEGRIRLIAIDRTTLQRKTAENLTRLIELTEEQDPKFLTYLIFTGDIKVRDEAKDSFPKYTVLLDPTEVITRSFEFQYALDYIVLDQKDFSTLQRGHLSDAHLAQGDNEAKTKIVALQKPLKKSRLPLLEIHHGDFTQKTLPALDQACIACHARLQTQQLFSNIESIRSWRAMMLKTIRLGLMPPGFDPIGAPTIGAPTIEQMRQIVAWIDEDAPAKPNEARRLEETFAKQKNADSKILKQLGQPDLVVEFPETVSITGEEKELALLKYFELPGRFEKEAVIDRVYIVTNSVSLHHFKLFASAEKLTRIGNYFQRPNEVFIPAKAKWDEQPAWAASFDSGHQMFETSRLAGFIANYPCYKNVCYRTRIPKGSLFTLQGHYIPKGFPETDRPKALIYFAKDKSKKYEDLKKLIIMPSPKTFKLEPHQGPTTLRIEVPVTKKTLLMGYLLHAHLRGTSGKFYVIKPNGEKTEPIFSEPFFLYMFQPTKFLQTPMVIEKGSRFVSEVIYDNSENNDSNPNPEVTVTMGEKQLEQDSHAVTLFIKELEP